MTYSIVARDAGTGEIGVATASRWPAVGSIVPWLESGVGAIVTQSFTNVDLGPEGLALLRDDRRAADVLAELTDSDPGRELRQVAVLDTAGRVAIHTGSRCVPAAGHVAVDDLGVAGNMLERDGTWELMCHAFEEATGDLAERLLTAIRAGERAGGDVRGAQSAALLVAPARAGARPWSRRFDLRVDDAAQPIDELARLLRVARAYEALERALDAAAADEPEAALADLAVAYGLAPEDAQVAFWYGVALTASDRSDEARPILRAALAAEPGLAEAGRRRAEADRSATFAQVLRSLPRPD